MRHRTQGALLTWITAIAAVSAASLGSGCDPAHSDAPAVEEAARSWQPLVSADGWAPLAAADDPAGHRPAEVDCTALGWYTEGETLEIDTGRCNYLAIEHASLESLAPGDELRLELWWQSLISLEPAQGHLALWIDDALVWEEFVAIPGAADARDITIINDRHVPAGAPIVFHLHNHGANTWRLRGLSALTATETAP